MDIFIAILAVATIIAILFALALGLSFIADVIHEKYFMSPERRAYEERERAFAVWAENKTRRLERERKELERS